MTTQEYKDGVAFINDEGKEVAFYSYFTDRIDFNPNTYSNWKEVGCSSIPFSDALTITSIANAHRRYKKE